jgi:hypothetical protein
MVWTGCFPAPAGDVVLPACTIKEDGGRSKGDPDRVAIDVGHTVSSVVAVVAGDEDGYVVDEGPRCGLAAAVAQLGGEVRSAALLLVSLAALAEAACAQAMLEGVRDQPA